MSAASAYQPQTGALDAFAVFPELPSLAERGLRDGVGGAYQTMRERGELIISGDRVSQASPDYLPNVSGVGGVRLRLSCGSLAGS